MGPTRVIRTLLLVLVVSLPAVAVAQDGKTAFEAKSEAVDTKPVESAIPPDFTNYLFVAYGLTCVFLGAFTLWTFAQGRGLAKRAAYLSERFDRAHPEETEDSGKSTQVNPYAKKI